MNTIDSEKRIVYLDQDFALVVKLAGEICQYDENAKDNESSLSFIVKPLLEERLGKKIDFCQCVHRLDRPVSGLCLIALSEKSFTMFSSVFTQGKVKKTYIAITEKPSKPLEKKEGILEGFITFNKKNQKAFMVEKNAKSAKNAKMFYKIFGEGERYLFVQAEPKTGRTHQIRCQLSSMGLPIKGDVKYGSRRSEPMGGIRLHAWKLIFENPKTKETMEFMAMPPVMDSLWQACFDTMTE